tara:strand:+ start:1687 stop:2190 length:504 start_codon:yes stop_codon:yes gene_type:complete
MKIIRFFFLILFIGCSSPKVYTDYDISVDFTQFKTFDFYEDNGENLNALDVKRITATIQENLNTVGLQQKEAPDFFIFFDTKTVENQNNNLIRIGLGNGGTGISGGIPIGSKKLNEKLTIKFIEAKNNDLFWEGSLDAVIKERRTPEKRELHWKEVIHEILKEFPSK